MRKFRLLPFGGRLTKNSNAKSARTLRAHAWTHVVLEARRCHFDGDDHALTVRRLVKSFAQRGRLRVENIAVEKGRISFNIRLRRKSGFAPFIRAITGALALKFSGASKNKALKKRFWHCRPWTCVIEKLTTLFEPQSLNSFRLDFELAELFRARHLEGLLLLGP